MLSAGVIKKKVATSKKQMPVSSISVVYKSQQGMWRGFVVPYDVTYEGNSKKKVLEILQSMRDLYVQGLYRYNSPTHLSDVPLSDDEDIKVFNRISPELLKRTLTGNFKFESKDLYAEAQLPA